MDCRLSRSLDGNFILQTPETDFMGRSETPKLEKVFRLLILLWQPAMAMLKTLEKQVLTLLVLLMDLIKKSSIKNPLKIQSSHFLILVFWNN
jgi:hypothetical protein